jgi:hypothetical protein
MARSPEHDRPTGQLGRTTEKSIAMTVKFHLGHDIGFDADTITQTGQSGQVGLDRWGRTGQREQDARK